MASEKIVKKHDKNTGGSTGGGFLVELKNRSFSKAEELAFLETETERVYARAFTNSQRTKAMSELRFVFF